MRHHPQQYDLKLDEEGWVSIDKLLSALKTFNQQWSTVYIGNDLVWLADWIPKEFIVLENAEEEDN